MLRPDDHGLIVREQLDVQVAKSGLAHPTNAIGASEVEAAGRHDQHVEARQQGSGIGPPLIIDQPLVDNERAAVRQRVIGFLQQQPFGREIPVVQHAAEDEHVSRRQRFGQEVSRVKLQARRKPVLLDVPLEVRPHRRQVEAAAGEVGVDCRDLHRQAALGGADIDKGFVVRPRELRRNSVGNLQAPPGHSLEESFQRRVIGIERGIMAGGSGAALRLAGSQCRRQQVPVWVDIGAEVNQLSADIGGLLAIEVEIGLRRIAIAAVLVALKHAKRDQGIEEVAGATLVDAEPRPERIEAERPFRERRENIKLDRTQQRLGGPEGKAELDDSVGRDHGAFHDACPA